MDIPGRVAFVTGASGDRRATVVASAQRGALRTLGLSHSSGENPQNIVHAEAFAAAVVHAVMESPAWPRTLLVWTFDEGGGYYDHVPPPPAAAPDDIPPLQPPPWYDGFARYGFRVPAVVVSPWARADHVVTTSTATPRSWRWSNGNGTCPP